MYIVIFEDTADSVRAVTFERVEERDAAIDGYVAAGYSVWPYTAERHYAAGELPIEAQRQERLL